MRHWLNRRGVARLLAITALVGTARALPSPQFPSLPPNEFVRQAVAHEVDERSTHNDRFMYRLRKLTPEKTETREYVETEAGTVGRLLALNDQPLSTEVARNENARLEKLLQDPALQRDRARKQKEEEQRIRRMVGALPDAFLYQYAEVEPGKNGPLVRLTFKPNPTFDPPTRELKVYPGMEGSVWIDPERMHLVKIEAQLFRDVDFGWAFLGRLYKGGRFVVEQTQIEPEHWETTHMVLSFEGRALIFKSLHIHEEETRSDFRRVGPALTLAQGIDLLRKVDANAVLSAQRQLPPQ